MKNRIIRGAALFLFLALPGCGGSAGEEFATFRAVNAVVTLDGSGLDTSVRGVPARLALGQCSQEQKVNNGGCTATARQVGGVQEVAALNFDLRADKSYTVAFAGAVGVANAAMRPRVFTIESAPPPALATDPDPLASQSALRIVNLSPDAPVIRVFRFNPIAGQITQLLGVEAGYGQASGYAIVPAQESITTQTQNGPVITRFATHQISFQGADAPDYLFFPTNTSALSLAPGKAYSLYIIGLLSLVGQPGGVNVYIQPDN